MIKRIKKLMDSKNLSATQFSEEIGIQRSSLSHVLSGRNKPSLDFMLKIKSRFPELNLDWLLLGSGEMFVQQELEKPEVVEPEIEFDVEEKARIDVTEEEIPVAKSEDPPTYVRKSDDRSRQPVQVILLYKDQTFSVYKTKGRNL